MSAIKAVVKNESLLLRRNRFLAIPFIVNLLCWGYIIFSYEMKSIHYTDRATTFYQGFVWMILLNVLIVGLFAVYMGSKDRGDEFESLVVTYKVKNNEWIMGKWIVTQLYGLCIALFTVVVQALWLLSASMTLEEWFKNIFYVLIQMEGAFFLLISMGFLFAILMKSMIAYLLIPATLVLSLIFPFDYVGEAYVWDNPKYHLLTPFDYMFIGSPYEGIWGIHHAIKNAVVHQSAVVLLGTVILIVTLLLFRRNRMSNREKRFVPLLLIGFIIPAVLLSGIRFDQYDKALKGYIDTGQRYVETFEKNDEIAYDEWENSYYNYQEDDHPYEFAMEKTNLAVELLANNQIRVHSSLSIKNNGDEAVHDVFLTLYHELEIKECTSSVSVTCAKEGDFIKLHFEHAIQPHDRFDLDLDYEGSILQYRNDGYTEHAFIRDDQIYLPKEAGWYPLIGKRPLVVAHEHDKLYTQFQLRNARLEEDFPTDFSVSIMRENEKTPLAMTIPTVTKDTFQGTSHYGLSLIGGNIKEEKVGETRVIAHPELFSGAHEVIERYQSAWLFVEDWLGVQLSPAVIYILSDNYYYLIRVIVLIMTFS